MVPFDGKYQNLSSNFFHNFYFRQEMKLEVKRRSINSEMDKPLAVGEIVKICLKIAGRPYLIDNFQKNPDISFLFKFPRF